ncbi:Formamidopyrimidine-DNA glycosylase N-terminal domain-containing protein [Lipomyces chichibuensis]|uniref:Formamidopyrimidine-DNA glycosylase N-terminal domain-containing protein n=1 Tax=Lipomyces chichibuensis TaxID=1546026 RepID=UPI0033432E11
MPELGEVAHAAKLLSTNLKGKTITKFITDAKDTLVFPSLSPQDRSRVESAYVSKKIEDVGRHGKYFWIILSGGRQSDTTNKKTGELDVMLMHFGMTGWLTIQNVRSHFFPMERSRNGKKPDNYDEEAAAEPWPPKYHKFLLTTDDGIEIAFTDPRRLSRVRFLEIVKRKSDTETVEHVESELMKVEPLVRMGPDFSKIESRWSQDQFLEVLAKRRVPIKSLLLDQAVCAGVGNWMADEILFQSRIHPEQYTDKMSLKKKELLYNELCEVCEVAVETEGDTEKFPKSWLMLHRWSKRQKQGERPMTADGYIVDFVTVGGRTSCFVPELQKIENATVEEDDDASERKPKTKTNSRTKKHKTEQTKEDKVVKPTRTRRKTR